MSQASTRGAVPPSPAERPWWAAPVPIAFGLTIAAAMAAVVVESRLLPTKLADPNDRVAAPGGGAFCTPVKLPASVGSATPPPPLPKQP